MKACIFAFLFLISSYTYSHETEILYQLPAGSSIQVWFDDNGTPVIQFNDHWYKLTLDHYMYCTACFD